jgi:fructose-bisphosphate aldolase class II
MFDASTMSYAENVAAARTGVHAPGARTEPEEARAFVEATGLDALAVAVGPRMQ